ncbi:hypothetical protein B7463_g7786, partial [Scytalidium lignicola]
MLLEPVYPGYDKFKLPSYSFLIHHKASNTRVLYDLGLRKDWRTHFSPQLVRMIASLNLEILCEKDTADILRENGTAPEDISAIIFSHHHWDHVGDTTKFPSSTSIIVGHGYKKYLPGWPIDPNSEETSSDLYEGRETVEIHFDGEHSLKIGHWHAYDYFHDGSFYLLDAPGHTQGHLCALARTTVGTDEEGKEDTFILLAGDSVHHGALFRPSRYYPLPDIISPAPYDDLDVVGSHCPCAIYVEMHRAFKDSVDEHKARTTSLCTVPADSPEEDRHEAERTVDKVTTLDGSENVFTIFAHDDTLLPLVDFFPKSLNL